MRCSHVRVYMWFLCMECRYLVWGMSQDVRPDPWAGASSQKTLKVVKFIHCRLFAGQ